jgi:PAS domain S-box-containing protein
MALVAPDGRWLHVNAALCQIVGYAPDELLARTFQDITHPADLDADLAYLRQMLAGEIRTYQMEKRYLRRTGEIVWVQLTVSLVRDAIGTPEFFISQIQDITTRKRAETALRQQAVVFDTVGDAIIVMDLNGVVTDWNPAAEQLYGYPKSEIVGRPVTTIHHPDLGDRLEAEIQACLRREFRWAGELRFRRRDGSDGVADVVVVAQRDDRGEPIAWIGVNRDVTEHRRLEEQFRQSQKMEAVGQLAGGIAHDFNNLLTVIRTYSELLLDQIDEANPLRGDLVEIQRAAGRAASLTRQLLAFSRKQLLQPKVLDLNGVVAGLEPMLRRLIGEDIRVVLRLGTRLGRIKADPGQLEQVLMNLAVNARDAMPGGGTLTISTTSVELDADYVGRRPVVIPGTYLMLGVSDTGTGMDSATRDRIFEPFFTTKEVGKGTGLGLSTVYGIVKQSGGYIWVYSEEGRGTTFKVYLPVIEADLRGRASDDSPAASHRGSEVVLLVEDEDAVRVLTRRLLERHGYTVLEARDGRDAVRVAAQYPQPIHIVVTDMVMPEMGGREVFEALRAIRPDLRVLYTSGYTDDEIVRRGLLDTAAAFLEKPFTEASLGAAVRAVLDNRDS